MIPIPAISQPKWLVKNLFRTRQGAWLELRTGMMWQENTGVTPTTSGGQTIGLLLGLDQQKQVGPPLVANGDFSDGTTNGWIDALNSPTVENVNGRLRISSASGTSKYVGYAIPVVAGSVYEISVDYYVNVDFTIIALGFTYVNDVFSSANTPVGNGTYTFRYYADITRTIKLCLRVASTGYNEFDNISVRQILGNHAYQATAANRPKYQIDAKGLPLVRHDTNDGLVCSLPNLGGGIYSAAGSCYFATPQGMSALHGVAMGLTYTLPALSTDIYAWCVFPLRLNALDERNLGLYMQQKAGLIAPDYLGEDGFMPFTDDSGETILAG